MASQAYPASRQLVLLLETIKGFRPPKVLIEWTFIDGLLAIHQGGGFMALTNPFGDLVEYPHSSAIVWSHPEDSLLRKHHFESPDASTDQADVFRPFTPFATSDRKYVIFSTAYAVFAIQLASLPGWHYRAETEATVLWAADPSLESRLAAAPVPLTRQIARPNRRSRPAAVTHPNQLGLLLYDSTSQQYSWKVLTLDPKTAGDGKRGDAERPAVNVPQPLPIDGSPVQILNVRDQSLVFATAAGHWLWSTEAARAGDCSAILYLPASDQSEGAIALDADMSSRGVFSWRNQHLLRKPDHDGVRHHEEEYFELWYARHHNGRYSVERRRVWPGDPEGTQKAHPQPVITDYTARPLGEWVSSDTDRSAREMLFAVESAGEIYRRPITGDDPRPLGNIQIGRLNEIIGFRLHDPLLVVIRYDPTSEKPHKVELRSLRHPDRRAIAAGLALKADPLPWSNFLFTCEETKQGVAIVRRDYSVLRSGGTGPAEPRFLESARTVESSG